MGEITSNEFTLLMDEIKEHRHETRVSLHEIRDELKVANGRTRKNETAIGVLETRAATNVCNLHGSRLAVLESQIGDLLGAHRKAIALSATAAAGLMAILEGVWLWFRDRP